MRGIGVAQTVIFRIGWRLPGPQWLVVCVLVRQCRDVTISGVCPCLGQFSSCHRCTSSLPVLMASHSLSEKDAQPSSNEHPTPIVPSYFNPVSPFFSTYDRFTRWRADLGLPYPGSVENTQKEVKGMFVPEFSSIAFLSHAPQQPISRTTCSMEPAPT